MQTSLLHVWFETAQGQPLCPARKGAQPAPGYLEWHVGFSHLLMNHFMCPEFNQGSLSGTDVLICFKIVLFPWTQLLL